MTYEIEKGFPIPLGAGTQGRPKYPWATMEVGDSIFVETAAIKGAYHAAKLYGWRHPGKKFCRRQVDGGYRIWRFE